MKQGMGQKAGLPPGSLLYTGEVRRKAVLLRGMDYDGRSFVELTPASVEELLPLRDSPAVTWIQVIGLEDVQVVEKLGTCFGIHPLVLEDILETHHRPKLEDYGDYLYLILRAFSPLDRNPARTEQVSLILGANYVLSFQEHGEALFEPLRTRLREGKGRLRTQGADYLAYAMIDTVVDHYFDVSEALGEALEELEDQLVLEPSRDTLQELHRLKRSLLLFRKAVWPLREAVGALSRGESALLTQATLVYVRDVYDHTIRDRKSVV